MNCNALKDKNILITGATSGIGKTIAEQFAKEGARLVLVGRREEILRQLQKDFGQNTITIPCDLSKTEDIEKIFTVCRENTCKLSGLVHCAGIAEMCGIRMFETEDAMNIHSLLLNCVNVFRQKKIPMMSLGLWRFRRLVRFEMMPG